MTLRPEAESLVVGLGTHASELTPSERAVLDVFPEADGTLSLTARDVIAASGVSKSTTDRALKALEKQGLLKRDDSTPAKWGRQIGPETQAIPSSPTESHGTVSDRLSQPSPLEGGKTGQRGGDEAVANCTSDERHRPRWKGHPVTGRLICPVCHPPVEPGELPLALESSHAVAWPDDWESLQEPVESEGEAA